MSGLFIERIKMGFINNQKATEDMRQEVYTRLINLLGGAPGKLTAYARRAVYEIVPAGGHLSRDWRGLEVHADQALDRMKKIILAQVGNLVVEIRQKEVEKKRIEDNLADSLPLGMWAEIRMKIEKIERMEK